MTQDLGVFARRLKATLNEAQKNNIQNTLRNVESLTSNIDSISYAIENAISEKESNDIKNMIENLSQTGQELREISQLVNTKVKEDLEKIDIFLEKLVVFSESSNEIIKSFEVSALKIDSVLNKLNNGNGTAALLLNDNSIYLSLDSLIKDARNVVTDFNDNPGKYIKAYFKSKKK